MMVGIKQLKQKGEKMKKKYDCWEKSIDSGYGCNGLHVCFEKNRVACLKEYGPCKHKDYVDKQCNLYKSKEDLDPTNPIQKKWAENYKKILDEEYEKCFEEVDKILTAKAEIKKEYPHLYETLPVNLIVE